ncbi:MAG: FG-GAP repeat protein [Planctomycetes bacterium]|nr:FG-GAP repeat protein [Planctomycetota bacterium]
MQQPLFTQQEVIAYGHHSWSISGIGDVNGSGTGDVVIGCPRDLSVTFGLNGGSGMLVDGNGSIIRYVYGGNGDRLGVSALGLGDCDGDGVPDFALGATQGDSVPGGRLNGYVAFYSGASTGNGAAQVIWKGITPTSSALNPDQFGKVLAAIGDWNGDGISEILVGTPDGHNPPVYQQQGYVDVYDPVAVFAGNLTPLLHVSGPSPASQFGISATSIPDLDGDSIPEFAVGAKTEPTGLGNSGTVRVYAGGTGTLLRVVSIDSDTFGTSVAGVKDINGDGKADLAVGVPGYGLFKGRVVMISGDWILTGNGVQTLATYKAADVHPDFFNINYDLFGFSMANVGDRDNDGFDDLLVGAPFGPSWDPDTDPNWPSGSTLSGCGYVRLISSVDGGMLKAYRGEAENDNFGYTVANVGDLNQDGVPDFGIGAPRKSINVAEQGRSYFYSGDYTVGIAYGATSPNSVGAGAKIGAKGALSISHNTFRLTCSNLPPNSIGLFLLGNAALTPPSPLHDGYLNVTATAGTSVLRFPAVSTGTGEVDYAVDFAVPPAASATLIDSRLYFQFWYRDAGFGPNESNLSDGLSAGFVN